MRWSDCHDAISCPLPFGGLRAEYSNIENIMALPSSYLFSSGIMQRTSTPPSSFLLANAEERMLPSMFFEHVGHMGEVSFRGSIPSLALKPDTSRLPASCRSLPHCMRDLVLGWWLTFTQVGLAPARIDKLAWRTKERKLHEYRKKTSL